MNSQKAEITGFLTFIRENQQEFKFATGYRFRREYQKRWKWLPYWERKYRFESDDGIMLVYLSRQQIHALAEAMNESYIELNPKTEGTDVQ